MGCPSAVASVHLARAIFAVTYRLCLAGAGHSLRFPKLEMPKGHGMRSLIGLAGLSICAAIVAGCSAASSALGPSVASYGASNIFSPVGYDQSQIDETHYKVTATGSEVTPASRVEKIAMARAAQIGADQKLDYFKVASVQHGAACSQKDSGYKGPTTASNARPTVVLDVLYSKDQADPGFQPSKATFEALSAELANETVSPEAQQAANQDILTRCGQS